MRRGEQGLRTPRPGPAPTLGGEALKRQRDEIRARRHEVADGGKVRRACHDRGLEQLGPPGHTLQNTRQSLRCARLRAEPDIVGPCLARTHRIIARTQVTDTDDPLRLHPLDRLEHTRHVVTDMNAVGTAPDGDLDRTVNQKRGTGRLHRPRHRPDLFDRTARVAAACGHDHGCDRDRREHGAHLGQNGTVDHALQHQHQLRCRRRRYGTGGTGAGIRFRHGP